jgi:hypothetical protein
MGPRQTRVVKIRSDCEKSGKRRQPKFFAAKLFFEKSQMQIIFWWKMMEKIADERKTRERKIFCTKWWYFGLNETSQNGDILD